MNLKSAKNGFQGKAGFVYKNGAALIHLYFKNLSKAINAILMVKELLLRILWFLSFKQRMQ